MGLRILLPLALAVTAACTGPHSTTTAPEPVLALRFLDVPITPIGEVFDVVTVPGAPDFLEVHDENAAWVMNPATNAIELVDLTGVVASVPVASPMGALTMAFGSLWSASRQGGQLIRIDPVSRAVIASIDAPMLHYESTMAAAGGLLWIMADMEGHLAYVDPTTNTVAGHVQVEPRSFGVAAGFGSVWVTNLGAREATGAGSIQRIDPVAKSVVATIPVGPKPLFLATGAGGVWVINQGDGTVSRVDPETNAVVATIELGIDGPGGDIAVGLDRVWVRATKTLLSVIDPATNAVVARYGPNAGSGGVRTGFGKVWLSAHDTEELWRLDAR